MLKAKSQRVRRLSIAALSVVFAVPLFLSLQASPAAAAGCQGSTYGSGAIGNCDSGGSGGGGGGGSYAPIQHGWDVLIVHGPCVINGYTSRLVTSRSTSTGDIVTYCERIAALETGGGTFVNGITSTTEIQAPPPKLTADYTQSFLTGAEVTFAVGDVGAAGSQSSLLLKDPGGNADNDIYLVLKPKQFKIDFGDGQSKQWNAGDSDVNQFFKHTYQTKSPNPENPDDHTVHVTITGTWSAHLETGLPGTPNNIPANVVNIAGDINVNSTLDRPIVEVWSALTEPN